MSIPQHKGIIKNVRACSGGYYYDRVAPGVTLPNEHLKGEELRAMSGEVKVYQLHSIDEHKQIVDKKERRKMKVPKGTKIIALDENIVLISEGDWPTEASSVVDFSAKYTEPKGMTPDGEIVYGNRGFKYSDKDTVWKFA